MSDNSGIAIDRKIVIVEFIKAAGLYRAGERCGLEPHLADAWVSRGFARIVKRDVFAIDPSLHEFERARRRAAEV